jgi:hypothetical protein
MDELIQYVALHSDNLYFIGGILISLKIITTIENIITTILINKNKKEDK